MATYRIDAPNGETYRIDGPAGASDADLIQVLLAQVPEAATVKTERTWGEAASDVMAGFGSGIGQLLQVPGKISGLVTGDMSETGLRGFGKSVEDYWKADKSHGLQMREALRQQKVQEAEKEGQVSAFLTSLGETVKDPALLVDFLAEQAPQLIPMIATGTGAAAIASRGAMSAAAARGAAVKAAEKVAAKKAVKAGAATAIQTGAVMQGADIGSGAYDEIVKELVAKGATPEQAAEQAINKARLAGVTGYALSVLANRYLPGGGTLERILAGEKMAGSAAKRAVGAALKEIPSENIEEVGGRIAQNIAAQAAGLDRDILAGTGETAAQATLGAAGLGGAAGAVSRTEAPAQKPAAEPEKGMSEIDILKAEQAQKDAEEAAAAAETPPVEGVPPVEAEAPPVEAEAPSTEAAAPAEEPKVRKVGEAAPLPDVLDTSTIAKIGFSRGSVHDTLVGKSSADPEVREILQKYMDVRRENGSLNPKTEAKITAFIARLPEQPAPSAETTTEEGAGGTQPTQVSITPPTEALSADTTQPAAGGAGAPVVSEPSAGAAPGGPGVVEPSGMVPPVADVEQPAGGEGTAPTAVVEGPKKVTLYRGVQAGNEGQPTVGGGLFMTPDRQVAETYAGKDGTVTESEVEFKNLLDVPKWTDAKAALGLKPDQGMSDIVNAAREKGYDGVSFTTTNGKEFISIPPAAQPEARVETPAAPPVSTAPAPAVEEQPAAPVTETVTAEAPKAYVAPVSQGAAARAKRGISKEAPVLDSETQIDDALAAGLIDEETADTARAQLTEPEAPTTAMGQAFQKQIDDIKSQMDALRQKSGKPPALKSPARAKFDELQTQLEALLPAESGTLNERLEKAGATGVFTVKDGKPVLDIPAVRESLKNRDPKMLKAVLTYIGVDEEGDYLPTTYSADEAAQAVGLKASSGANVRRTAETLGITADVISRFQAAQTEKGVGAAKNVSEASLSGISVENPKSGLLYESDKKGVKAVGFLRPALTETGQLDFTKLDTRQLADIYSRASRYDARDNTAVMQQLSAEVEARRKADRKGTDAAINRAYGKLVAEEEAQLETEGAPEDYTEEADVEDTGPRLSDEDYQQTRTGPVDLENSKQMDDALRGKSFMEALDYAIENSRDEADRHVLVKVKRRAEELAAKGVEFSFGLTPQGRVLIDAFGITTTTPARLGEATTVKVTLNGFTGDPKNTLNQEVLAHEMVHAVTSAQIMYAPQSTAATKLRALQQELVRIYNQRHKAGTLTATEKGVVTSALANPRELLAYGLTNGETQNWLASITDPSGGTFLSRLFDIVSQALGLKGKETSALARLMTISEEILDESLDPYVAEANRQGMSLGKQANTTGYPSWTLDSSGGRKPAWHKGSVALYEVPSNRGGTIYVARKKDVGFTNVDIRNYTGSVFTPAELAELRQAANGFAPQTSARAQTEAAAGKLDVIGEQKERPGIREFLKGNPALKVRVLAVDNTAALKDKFAKLYDGVRSKQGWLNPMVLMSRARDYMRFAKGVRELGGWTKEQGLILPTELHDSTGRAVSYNGVLGDIAAEAKRLGQSFEKYLKTVDRILYAHREYNLRERNRGIEEQIAALEAAGKDKNAKKIEALRGEIVELKIKNDANLDAAEEAFQNDEFIKQVSKDLDTIRFNGIDMLVETGRISADKAQEWKDATGYIPFNRIEEYFEKYKGSSEANKGITMMRQIRSLEGSERQVTSPVLAFSSFIDWATKESMFNDAALNAAEDLELVGAAKKQETKPFDAPGDIVDVYKNGEMVKYYVADPLLAVGFQYKIPNMTRALKVIQTFSRILRAGVTSLPPFAVKQVSDDIFRAYAYAGAKDTKAMAADILKSFFKDWAAEIAKRNKSPALKELSKHGLVTSFGFHETEKVRNLLKEADVEKEGLAATILRVMEAGAKASDEAIRQGVYNAVLEQTKSEKFPKGDMAAAESAARELINFSNQGVSPTISWFVTAVPFFNAWAQGLDKLATAAAGRYVGENQMSVGAARSMFYNRVAALTAIGIMYAFMTQDDDEIQRLPDYERDSNFILPGVKIGGSPVGIPIPGDLAFFFKAIPERVIRYIKSQGTQEEQAALSVVGELVKRGREVFLSPNLTPQILRPLYENITNYSWFLNRPLESQSQLGKRPYLRAGSGTSDSMKLVAEGLEKAAAATGIEAFAVSPIKLENAVRGVFGTSAGLALTMADAMVNPSRTDRPLNRQLIPQLTGASTFLKSPVGSRYKDLAFDLEKDVTQAYNSYKDEIKNHPDRAKDAYERHRGMVYIKPQVDAMMNTLRVLDDQARTIDGIKNMPTDERRQRINEVHYKANTIARESMRLRTLAMRIQKGEKPPQ